MDSVAELYQWFLEDMGEEGFKPPAWMDLSNRERLTWAKVFRRMKRAGLLQRPATLGRGETTERTDSK